MILTCGVEVVSTDQTFHRLEFGATFVFALVTTFSLVCSPERDFCSPLLLKFLVFANRFLAFFAAVIGLRVSGEPLGRSARSTPLYKFSFASVSNIFSSVSQYEALKYVSFPTQVLAKSCKMVPVMLMGYLVSQRTYKPFEYLVAVAVTAGAMIFKLYETNDAPVQNTEFIGIVLIVAYMGCDSFTSNWQSKIFTQ